MHRAILNQVLSLQSYIFDAVNKNWWITHEGEHL